MLVKGPLALNCAGTSSGTTLITKCDMYHTEFIWIAMIWYDHFSLWWLRRYHAISPHFGSISNTTIRFLWLFKEMNVWFTAYGCVLNQWLDTVKWIRNYCGPSELNNSNNRSDTETNTVFSLATAGNNWTHYWYQIISSGHIQTLVVMSSAARVTNADTASSEKCSVLEHSSSNAWGWRCSTGPFQFRWLKG